MKRNIKFDDQHMDLVLDFCFDPDAGNWRKICPGQAKAVKSRMGSATRNEEVGEDELEIMFGNATNQGRAGSRSSGAT